MWCFGWNYVSAIKSQMLEVIPLAYQCLPQSIFVALKYCTYGTQLEFLGLVSDFARHPTSSGWAGTISPSYGFLSQTQLAWDGLHSACCQDVLEVGSCDVNRTFSTFLFRQFSLCTQPVTYYQNEPFICDPSLTDNLILHN